MNFPSVLLYYLVILPVSWLPFRLLYALSDFLYLVLYHLIGYRKKIVISNLRNSYPLHSDAEIEKIASRFYRHFCDLVVESLKIFSISEEAVHERMDIRDPSLINSYFDAGRSVIIAGGHYNNWELFAVGIDARLRHQTIGIYKPLSNKFFDAKMRLTRSKYGLEMVSTKRIKSVMEETKDQLTAVIFATDQSPSNPQNAYWMNFLNQDTGVLFGTEKYAKEYNCPVFYGRLNKTRRGHYEFEMVLVTDDPQSLPYGKLTEMHTRLLEEDINKDPAYWLWTHRRWKHKRPATITQAL